MSDRYDMLRAIFLGIADITVLATITLISVGLPIAVYEKLQSSQIQIVLNEIPKWQMQVLQATIMILSVALAISSSLIIAKKYHWPWWNQKHETNGFHVY